MTLIDTAKGFFGTAYNYKTGFYFLILCLLTDFGFGLLHILRAVGFFSADGFFVNAERGYAEIFQYVKEVWSGMILLFVTYKRKSLLAAVWSLLFFYFFIDDSTQFHEKTDNTFGDYITLTDWGILPYQDVWQVVTGVVVALISLSIIYFVYRRSNDILLKTKSIYLLFGVLVLGAFGVGIDVIHALFRGNYLLDTIFALAEDLGEMIGVSIIISQVADIWLTSSGFLLPADSRINHEKISDLHHI